MSDLLDNIKECFIPILIALVILFILMLFFGLIEHLANSQPCEEYKNISINRIPSRCISYYIDKK